jgi:hypothetical protein
MLAVALRTMLGLRNRLAALAAAKVGGHASAFVQDLNNGWRRADLHQLVHQVVGHAVEVPIEGHVVINIDAGARPLTQIEGFHRKRFQRGLVDRFLYAGARAVFLAERPVIQL